MAVYYNGPKRRWRPGTFGVSLTVIVVALSAVTASMIYFGDRSPTISPKEQRVHDVARAMGLSVEEARNRLDAADVSNREYREKVGRDRQRTQDAIERLDGAICAKEPWRTNC